MPDILQLPFAFNAEKLKADMEALPREAWIPHFNTYTYSGKWMVAALRSINGIADQIYPDPTATGAFRDTMYLEQSPYIQEILATFKCQIESVRFLLLSPGSVIREHTDMNLGYEDGEIRLHIPVVTAPEVEFYLKGERVIMNEGECWYLNFNLPHRIENKSDSNRVHLVVDCVVNDWMNNFFTVEQA